MHAPSKAATHLGPSAHLTLRVQCEAPDCGALLEVAVPRSHIHHGQIIVRCGNCNRLLKVLLGDRYAGAAGSGGHAHGDVSHQHGGSAWAGDEAQGEGRFDAQHSGRGAAQQGLLPDPKEDANRVIEDILARSNVRVGDPAWANRYGEAQPLPRRYAQQQGGSAGRPATPRTYVAPHISNFSYSSMMEQGAVGRAHSTGGLAHAVQHSLHSHQGSPYSDHLQYSSGTGTHASLRPASRPRLQTPADLFAHAQQTSGRTEDLMQQRGHGSAGAHPQMQEPPDSLYQHLGYGGAPGYSPMHGHQYPSSAPLSQGYRNDLGTGQDMYGLSSDPYDLHPELYSRGVHGHGTGDSSARLEDPKQQPQGFMGWQQPPAAHAYPSAGRKRPAAQLQADRQRSEMLAEDHRDLLRGERWKLQRVRSLSALPSDADLLAGLKQDSQGRGGQAKSTEAHKAPGNPSLSGAALEQQGTPGEQEPAEQQALQYEAASQAPGLPDEARMKQQAGYALSGFSSELSLSPNGGIAAAVPGPGMPGQDGQHASSVSLSNDAQPTFMVPSGPQSAEAAAEMAPLLATAPHHPNDPSSPRSQGSFNIFNLSPQDFSLSPMHRGHADSQQNSPTGGALSPFAMSELRFTPTPPPQGTSEHADGHAAAGAKE